MKTQLWVESHQPVPLVPLSMLKIDPGDVIYIGQMATDECPGWVLAGEAGLFVCLETGRYLWDDDLDYEHTLGRKLQSGESVLVRYTSG